MEPYSECHLGCISFMLYVTNKPFMLFHDANCRYAEFRYAECRGALFEEVDFNEMAEIENS